MTLLGGIDLTPMLDKDENARVKLTRFATKVRAGGGGGAGAGGAGGGR